MDVFKRLTFSSYLLSSMMVYEALKALHHRSLRMKIWGIRALWTYSKLALKYPKTAVEMINAWNDVKWVEEKKVP